MDLNFLALPGTAVFAGPYWRRPSWDVVRPSPATPGPDIPAVDPSMMAISFMVGLAFITRYSGMDTVLGLSLTHTGWIYPLFGTLLGWLG